MTACSSGFPFRSSSGARQTACAGSQPGSCSVRNTACTKSSTLSARTVGTASKNGRSFRILTARPNAPGTACCWNLRICRYPFAFHACVL